MNFGVDDLDDLVDCFEDLLGRFGGFSWIRWSWWDPSLAWQRWPPTLPVIMMSWRSGALDASACKVKKKNNNWFKSSKGRIKKMYIKPADFQLGKVR